MYGLLCNESNLLNNIRYHIKGLKTTDLFFSECVLFYFDFNKMQLSKKEFHQALALANIKSNSTDFQRVESSS